MDDGGELLFDILLEKLAKHHTYPFGIYKYHTVICLFYFATLHFAFYYTTRPYLFRLHNLSLTETAILMGALAIYHTFDLP